MNTVLYFSTRGPVYETRAYTKADIDRLVQNHQLHCLTSTDRQFDFWFSPSTARCQSRVNARATELLLATTKFTAKSVPLLPGSIVVATHDADGDLDGLSWEQLDLLVRKNRSLSDRELRVLDRRIARHDRRLARHLRSAPAAPAPQVKPRVAVAAKG
ncbi:hypothetical protein FHT40_000772 [Mycolicibacterium sp. BK556]|uniref:hypothetical protein n=1 Tax=Mycobacteriaceae TaxID=1762 RepID=UPI00105D2009|nr:MULTISPECIES: hypothetical protein [Mycobacteriaceae]MBB3601139.1 hypothetical protein [Mycolicibacterium sp. BK556]MBB3630892.1 hypothetical protein [Mycolicibacterium sp. BK607]MBB3748893.1 hypothetical protein [Mycolicibacterium sp. BK634]TDO14895.1 hypothetical protein EV580_3033 [Mycobacterium sp. BK086]